MNKAIDISVYITGILLAKGGLDTRYKLAWCWLSQLEIIYIYF